ncbi:MAG: EamA family transporter, partial [Rhodobacteraceae bacterium]|nr:EamA family transporter [Paracoccaceae bacterium]
MAHVAAVIILRPGLRELGSGHLAQIVAALCFSGSYLFARGLSRMLPAGTVVLGSFAHYAMTRAFAAAPLAVTQPVTFLQIVWASLMGVVVFAEPVDPFVILGGAVIIAAISAFALHETRGRAR